MSFDRKNAFGFQKGTDVLKQQNPIAEVVNILQPEELQATISETVKVGP